MRAPVLVQDMWCAADRSRRAVRDANDDIPTLLREAVGECRTSGRRDGCSRTEDAERTGHGLGRSIEPDTGDTACASHRFGGGGEPDSIEQRSRRFDCPAYRDRFEARPEHRLWPSEERGYGYSDIGETG